MNSWVVAYSSKSPTEALGVFWAVTYLRTYLERAENLVRCDHRALLSVFTNMSPNSWMNRWRLRLSECIYEIRHIPGKEQNVADVLSRLPTEGLDSTPLDYDIPVLAIETRERDVLEAASPAEAPMGALSAQEKILGQAEDTFCQERLKELDVRSPPARKWSRKSFFFREKNGLPCRHAIYGRETQVVIQQARKQRRLQYEHQSVLAVHPGSWKMYDTLDRCVNRPTLVVDVNKRRGAMPRVCEAPPLREEAYVYNEAVSSS